MRKILFSLLLVVPLVANGQWGWYAPLLCKDTTTQAGSARIMTFTQMVAYIYSHGSSMTWPSGSAGIPNYNGSSAWGTTYNSGNTIPANFIPTLNQNTTGTAHILPSDTSGRSKVATYKGVDSLLSLKQNTKQMVTSGLRTTPFIDYTDTFFISKDTILAGTVNHPLIRTYGTDTTVVITTCQLMFTYRVAYVSAGTDTIGIFTKQNNLKYRVVSILDPIITTSYSGCSFFPIAIDKKDQGARWWLYIPHIYTTGTGSMWIRLSYYLIVRKYS